MSKIYDAIIVGLGAMGLSIAQSLSARGLSVLGLEKNSFMHDKGSSHGASRIFRTAYFEGDFYTPLLTTSRVLWRQLEAESDMPLLRETGVLYGGPKKGSLIENTKRSAERYAIPLRELKADEVRDLYPRINISVDHNVIVEPGAGILNPDQAAQAFRDVATRKGAHLRFNSSVESFFQETNGVYGVTTSKGDEYCRKLIICAGGWTAKIFRTMGYNLMLRTERKTLHWFDPMGERDSYLPHRLPANVWELNDGSIFYGFPYLEEEGGLKYGYHSGVNDISTDADKVDRSVSEFEIARVKQTLEQVFDGEVFRYVRSKTCLYTMTPDEHFAIGSLPDNADLFIAGGFSGHGYKFVPVVGEIMADLVEKGSTSFDIKAFNPARLLQESDHKK